MEIRRALLVCWLVNGILGSLNVRVKSEASNGWCKVKAVYSQSAADKILTRNLGAKKIFTLSPGEQVLVSVPNCNEAWPKSIDSLSKGERRVLVIVHSPPVESIGLVLLPLEGLHGKIRVLNFMQACEGGESSARCLSHVGFLDSESEELLTPAADASLHPGEYKIFEGNTRLRINFSFLKGVRALPVAPSVRFFVFSTKKPGLVDIVPVD